LKWSRDRYRTSFDRSQSAFVPSDPTQTIPLVHIIETRARSHLLAGANALGSSEGAFVKARIDLVVFDMAGTTVSDDGDVVARALAGAISDVLGISSELDDIRGVMGLPKPDAIRILVERSGVGARASDVERAHAGFLRAMIRHYLGAPSVREIHGASETFRRLRARGVKVALDTGFSRPIVDAICSRLGWQEGVDIDVTVASDEVEQGRPAPDMIHRAMARTGVTDPARVAKVGDTPADLLQGRAAACGLIVGVGSGSSSLETLARFPHSRLVRDLRAVPGLLEELSGRVFPTPAVRV